MRILLVDDDQNMKRLAELQLTQELGPVIVDQAYSTRQAREFLGQVHYDLCVIDHRLPDGKGLELLHGLRARFIYATFYLDSRLRKQVEDYGGLAIDKNDLLSLDSVILTQTYRTLLDRNELH